MTGEPLDRGGVIPQCTICDLVCMEASSGAVLCVCVFVCLLVFSVEFGPYFLATSFLCFSWKSLGEEKKKVYSIKVECTLQK